MTGRIVTPQEAQTLREAATPGPWRVGAEGSEGSRVNPDCADKRESSRYIARADGRVQPVDGRNARLIAAAPDLAFTVEQQAAQIAAVLALHKPQPVSAPSRSKICAHCRDRYGNLALYPCQTARALEGTA